MTQPTGPRSMSRPQTTPQSSRRGDGVILRRLFRDYVLRYWPMLLAAAGTMGLASAMNGALAWLPDPATKIIFLQKSSHMLAVIPLAILAIMTLRAVGTFCQDLFLNSVAERVISEMQRDMFASQIHLDINSINASHSAELISNFLYDTTLLRNSITRGVAGLGLQLISFVAYVVVMFYEDWQLSLISIALLPLVAWVTQALSRSLRKSSTRGMEESGVLSKALSEALTGRRIIKAYNLEDHAAASAARLIAQRLRYLLRAVRARAAAVPATDLIGGVAAAITFAYAGYQHFNGQLEINQFMGFLTSMLLAQQPIRTLSQLWTISSEGLSAAGRIFSVIDAKPTIVDRADAKPLTLSGQGASIVFDRVCFAYRHEETEPAIDEVTISITAGQKIALVGPSGAGKTTLFNLLLRFYDIDSGTISIDGTDIREITLESLRNHIALVTQEPILFDESVADNIALGRRGASRDDIITAAKAAAADDFIRQMEQGYDAGVGENGLKLSGGQRQRIAIARAMLRDAPILLLDEATSALDNDSERQVQEALDQLMKGRTTLVIAHRLSTVLDADRIFVMERGRVVEAGTHSELIARKGLYSRLYQRGLAEDTAMVAG